MKKMLLFSLMLFLWYSWAWTQEKQTDSTKSSVEKTKNIDFNVMPYLN